MIVVIDAWSRSDTDSSVEVKLGIEGLFPSKPGAQLPEFMIEEANRGHAQHKLLGLVG